MLIWMWNECYWFSWCLKSKPHLHRDVATSAVSPVLLWPPYRLSWTKSLSRNRLSPKVRQHLPQSYLFTFKGGLLFTYVCIPFVGLVALVLHSHLLTLKPEPTPTQTTSQTGSRCLQHSVGHRTARLSSSSFLWFPLFISTTSDFEVCVSVQMQLMHTSSLKPSGISQNLSHPFSSYYKLFACNASGCHVARPGRGLGCRCFCLGLVAQSTPHFVFLVSWRARLLVGLVSRWLVCLFISNSQWPAYVCINTEGQLPVITDHTHVCIYKPIIYSMYCNCVSACRRRRVLYMHCGRFPRKKIHGSMQSTCRKAQRVVDRLQDTSTGILSLWVLIC